MVQPRWLVTPRAAFACPSATPYIGSQARPLWIALQGPFCTRRTFAAHLAKWYTVAERLFVFVLIDTMAQKRRTRKKRTTSPLDQFLATAARPEVLGLLLILLSVFTLLSLVTGSRGQITNWWIESLESIVGIGVWGLPLVTGALGLWVVIRAIERMPDLPWQRGSARWRHRAWPPGACRGRSRPPAPPRPRSTPCGTCAT